MIQSDKYKIASDSLLITFLMESDHAAYTEIYRRYSSELFTHAYKRLKDQEQTKDIVQELFITLWLKRESFSEINNLGAYLVTSVKNKVFTFFEHQVVQLKYIESLKDYANTGSIAHTDYLIRENDQKATIDCAIQSLPTKMRVVFEMSRKNNLPHKEIASKLSTSENNVAKHITTALKLLKARLGVVVQYASICLWAIT